MRITLDGLTKEQAIDIYEWLLDDRAKLFYQQLRITEQYAFDHILRDLNTASENCNKIKAMRGIVEYIDYLRDFISEGVTGKES